MVRAVSRLAERRALAGSFGGWASDAFDYQIFGLALPLMLASWPLSSSTAGTIVTVSLASASIGGVMGGALSDRFGRLPVLRSAILVVALATAACAFVTAPWQLLVSRTVQGLGFGAEWAVGAVLLAEAAPAARRGRFLGVMQSAWALGWAGAVIVFLLATALLPEAQAWRAMFLVGLLPVGFVVWLRRGDMPAAQSRAKGDTIDRSSGLRSRLVFTGLLGLGAHGGYHSLFTWLPTLLRREAGFSTGATGAVLLMMTAGFGAGCIVAGTLSDRLGRRATVALFAGGSLIGSALFTLLAGQLVPTLALALLIGFAAGGTPAVLGTWFAELFPAPIRGAGVGFAYNAGRIISAVLPGAIGWGAQSAPLALLIATAAAASYGLVLVVLPMLPETRGRDFVASVA